MSLRTSSSLLCTVLALACNGDAPPPETAPTQAPPSAEEEAPDEATVPTTSLSSVEQIDRKLELYIVCLARSARRMADSWERYVQDVDPETGKPRKRKQAPFLYRIDNELAPCRKAAERGPSWKPSLPEHEAALERYVEAAQAFAEITQTLDAYYREEGFRKDDWQKGQELAPAFASAHAAWEKARDELRSLVDAKKDEVDLALLEQIEQTEGKELRYLTQTMLIDAKNYARCALAVTGAGSRCDKAREAFERSHRSFQKNIENAPERAKQVFWMLSFAESATQFREEVTRMKAAQTRPRKLHEARERLREAYLDLTRAAANLRFDFPTAKRPAKDE